MLRLYALAAHALLRLAGARRKVLEDGPVSLAYYAVGPAEGEPWVLLHGLGAVAATWAPVMRALGKGCRVLIPEMSALGGTKAPKAGLGVMRGARTIARLIEKELGGRPVTLAGISLGGWTAVRLALRRPDLVSRLVLIDAGGYRAQDWDKIQELVRVQDMPGLDRLYGALFGEVPWVMRVSRKGFLQTYTSPAVTETLDELEEIDTFHDEDLARLRVPTALIWGERDGLFTVEVARAMAAALPNVHLEVIPGCGHAVHIECPERMIEAIQRFRHATTASARIQGCPAPST